MSTSVKLDAALKAKGWRFNAVLGAFYDQLGQRVSYQKLLALVPNATENEFAAWVEDQAEKLPVAGCDTMVR